MVVNTSVQSTTFDRAIFNKLLYNTSIASVASSLDYGGAVTVVETRNNTWRSTNASYFLPCRIMLLARSNFYSNNTTLIRVNVFWNADCQRPAREAGPPLSIHFWTLFLPVRRDWIRRRSSLPYVAKGFNPCYRPRTFFWFCSNLVCWLHRLCG